MQKGKVNRKAKIKRTTTETEIECILNIDGKGTFLIDTGIGLLNHMLELFSFHGLFDIVLKVSKADLKIDLHHTNEDVGIVLGQVFKKALGDMKSIRRFGFASVPMEDILADVSLDISGRGHFSTIRKNFATKETDNNYNLQDANHFFESFAKHSGVNLIIKIEYNQSNPSKNSQIDLHTCLEATFKAWALSLDRASSIDPRRKGVPSTKGIID